MHIELITEQPKTQSNLTPLLFIHGAGHSAWCWENFLPFFAEQGYEAHAISLRGHGASGGRDRIRSICISEYLADVADAVSRLRIAPVLIGHSMGGFVIQKYLEQHCAPGAVLMAPIPIAGIFNMLVRLALRYPWQSLKCHVKQSVHVFVETPELAREVLFSPSLPSETLIRHFERIQDESYRACLDAALLNLPRPSKVNELPMLVLGAENDMLFTQDEVRATARAYRTHAEIFPGMAHDMMLDTDWRNVAERILQWLKERGL